MYSTRCVLAVVALCVVLARSWDIAVTKGDLLEFYTNETKSGTVRLNSHNVTTLAYDEVHDMMLYVDKQSDNDAICGYGISSMENKCFTERNGRNIHGLAFDPATELLFFSDTNERSINWFSLKRGSNNNIYGNLLMKMNDGIPTDIAVDSCRGYVYWINTNLTTPVIERARFDGSEREVVINTNLLSINTTYKLEPHSLAIDQQTQKIYWIEPETILTHPICYADLNGKNKKSISYVTYKLPDTGSIYPSKNTLTVSKSYLFWVDWCAKCHIDVWKIPKTSESSSNSKDYYTHFTLHDSRIVAEKVIVSVASNYKIAEQNPGIKDCEPVTRLERNNSEGPFCVHGMKVNGQSLCKCTPGYTGERCDVSVCENYCLQGNCSVNDEGLPNCRCNAGYTGDRCDVYACHGYCMNNGDCSLNEKKEPVCQCKGDYVGNRCEVSDCLNYCIHGICSFIEEGNPECRCNAGYSGERCDVYACHGYCLNDGDCSLDEENKPFCKCVGNHEGPRCEAVPYSAAANLTLADLLSKWGNATAKNFVYVEN